MTNSLRVPAPGRLCEECVRDCALESPTKDSVVVYCEHYWTAGVYVTAEGQWHLVNPVTRDKFVEAMVAITQAVLKASTGGTA